MPARINLAAISPVLRPGSKFIQADEPPCECAGPGYCMRYRIQRDKATWEKCAAVSCSPEESQLLRNAFARSAQGRSGVLPGLTERAPRPELPRGGVGTELALIVEGLGRSIECSSCNDWVARMNEWGPDGCEARTGDIEARLKDQRTKLGWRPFADVATLALAAWQGITVNPLHPERSLVEAAVRTTRGLGVAAGLEPLRRVALDPAPLSPKERVTNPGLLKHPLDGRLLLAFRDGWDSARVGLALLSPNLDPLKVWRPLALPSSGPLDQFVTQEDPRLFWHAGSPYLNWVEHDIRTQRADQWYGRLVEDAGGWSVAEAWNLRQPGSLHDEKNWASFPADGQLYAVYAVAPQHVVVRIDGAAWRTVARTDYPQTEIVGHLRGGAPPLRVGDEFWHFCHVTKGNGRRKQHTRYAVALYAFKARPPFAVTRHVPLPLEWEPGGKPKAQVCPVIFPGGAALDGRVLSVACGTHDHGLSVHQWDVGALDRAMVSA